MEVGNDKIYLIDKSYMIILGVSMCISMYAFSFLKSLPLIYIIFLLYDLYCFTYIIKTRTKITLLTIFVVIILLLFSMLSLLFNANLGLNANFIINFGKLLIWGMTLSFTIIKLNKQYLYNILYKVSIVVTLYLFIQSLFFYIFSISLSNVFDFGIITFRTLDMGTLTTIYRPSSFFAEPIDYSNFIIMCLTLSLFDEKYKSIAKMKGLNFFYFIGILFAASTTGIFICLMVFFLYILLEKRKNIKFLFPMIIIGVPLMVVIYSNLDKIMMGMGSLGTTLYKTINKVNYASSNSRVGGSFDRIMEIPYRNLPLGFGIGNEYYLYLGVPTYMNTITRLIFQFGVLGLMVITLYFIRLYLKSVNNAAKVLIIISVIEFFTSNILFSISNILMMSIIFLCNRKENN